MKPPNTVKLFCGVLAVSEVALQEAQQRLGAVYGPIDLTSDSIPFDCTDYYRDQMGPSLLRRFVSFAPLVDPGCLAEIKLATNGIEGDLCTALHTEVRRPVNLDPGYLTSAKVVLATTKDFAHRIYLRKGVYAEVTFAFSRQGCRYFPWTYPDYRSGRYEGFFLAMRDRLLESRATRVPAAD